jgi:sialate O-acetylesterase
MKAGGPYDMVISEMSSKTREAVITIENVLVGDVFLCSGQSNMELPIRRCMDVVANEVKDYSNDNIRYLKLPHQFNYVRPNDDVMVRPWQNITPQNCAEVSGICYFMARELQERYKVPIGIINSAVGGTQVQAWMPQQVLAPFEGYDKEFQKTKYHQENWVDSIRRLETRAGMGWDRRMVATDTVVQRWKRADYNYGGWQQTDIFSNWSKGKNGSYWFHTTIDLPASVEGKPALLRLGAMKDADSTFVNGTCVGNTTYEYPPRNYNVKEGLLKAGRNDIVVHLMSQGGHANFTRGKLYQLEVDGQVFPIGSDWQMAVGCHMPSRPTSTYFVDCPTGLYNAMIAPLKNLPVKGILWYQGESNQGNTSTYSAMLEAMTTAWRQQLGKSNLPLVIMQLPGYMGSHEQPHESGWTRIRHEQYLASQRIKNAALAPTFDTGEFNDIHPQDKKTAGHRAALQMEKLAYGEKAIVSSGPTPIKVNIKNGRAMISFDRKSGRLVCKGDKLKNFAIKVDGKYQWADATIDNDYTVAVEVPRGTNHTTIRYGWDDYPTPSLYNEEGIPAPQFQIETK